MVGWSSNNHSSCSYIDVEVEGYDECEEILKILFDQALLIFLEEEGDNRSLPVVVGDGEKVDLFKLFVLVGERQGFDSVSTKGLWNSVAEKLGLGCSVSPSLRLIYSKYLERMKKWAASGVVNWDNQESYKKGCYGGLLHDLGHGFKDVLENRICGKRNRAMVFGCQHIEESSSEVQGSRKRFRESIHDDNDEEEEELEVSCVALSDDSNVSTEGEGLDLFSEKQDDLQGMLKWLTSIASSPHDPSIGVITQWSKWKEYTGNECWIQVTRAKNALLVQRDNAEFRYQNSPLLGNQTMHPSMYEDDRKSIGRLRYSTRRPHSSKSLFGLCCNGRLVSLTKSGSTNCREQTTAERTDLILGTSITTTHLVAGTSGARDLQECSNAITERAKSENPRRYVSVGRNFQARVDEWTESDLASNTKWLGTCIWPLEVEEPLDHTLGNDLIGKGRPDFCSCDIHLRGSVECIRFHIAEKRMELKRDLGDVFLHWRFNQMGEEVSLRWTEREEKKFKDMMIKDPECFWENAAKSFRGKKREQLVSYYFNVFLINRRRYQNRVTPRDIGSDDEGAFGSVGNSFGRNAVTMFGSDIMICSQNGQSNGLD